MISEFRLTRRVQFHETDAAGIVHFSCFFRYMEEAEHGLWRAAGLSIAPPDAGVGFPRVAASFEFIRPLRFEDEFEVLLEVTKKSTKSMAYRATVTKDGEVAARGTLAVACVAKKSGQPMRSTPIPPDIASRFAVAPAAAPETGPAAAPETGPEGAGDGR